MGEIFMLALVAAKPRFHPAKSSNLQAIAQGKQDHRLEHH
jgi:hypothetical protein